MRSQSIIRPFSLLIIGALGIAALSPFLGSTCISPAALWEAGNPDAEVFWRLRLPRSVAAFLSGAGLAVSGMVFQALFRNPLATPFTLGVSSGASFGASLYIRLGAMFTVLGSVGTLGAALVGGGLSMVLVYLLTRAKGGLSTPVMLLAGVVINFFFSSLVLFTQYLSDANNSLRIMHWLMGSLTAVEIPRLADLACIVTIGSLLVWRYAQELDLLVAGEEFAASRGVAIKQAKIRFFVLASVMVCTVVSLIGPVGFVGMMIPHVCRLWLGWAHRLLLPAVFVSGGGFLALSDVISRTILAPAEMPIGIITALGGAPFFLWTLFRSGRQGEFI